MMLIACVLGVAYVVVMIANMVVLAGGLFWMFIKICEAVLLFLGIAYQSFREMPKDTKNTIVTVIVVLFLLGWIFG